MSRHKRVKHLGTSILEIKNNLVLSNKSGLIYKILKINSYLIRETKDVKKELKRRANGAMKLEHGNELKVKLNSLSYDRKQKSTILGVRLIKENDIEKNAYLKMQSLLYITNFQSNVIIL